MMAPTLMASVTTSPAASSLSVLDSDSRRQPATAPTRITVPAAVTAVSQMKYCFHPLASRAPRMRSAWAPRWPSTNVVSSLLMEIWDSCTRGRTGPVNRRSVGRLWPNRSISPGPDQLRLGAVAPTWITCPATVTVCIGVTSSAAAIAAPASTTSISSPASHRSGRRVHRPARSIPPVVPIPPSKLTNGLNAPACSERAAPPRRRSAGSLGQRSPRSRGLGDRVLRQVVLGLGKLQHGDETPGVISPEAISCCSPVDGPARPEYFRPVAPWNAGATIFSFRYKREAAQATFAVPEGLAAGCDAEGVEEEELPQPTAASPRHTIPSNAPKRAPLFTVKKTIPKDGQYHLRQARSPDAAGLPEWRQRGSPGQRAMGPGAQAPSSPRGVPGG